MNISREEAQQILDALERTSNYMKCTEAVFSQGRMYLDMTLMPSLSKNSDAAITLLSSRLAEGEQESAYAKVETEILTRYRVESTGRGFWPAVVRCGTGAMDIFVGTKKQAEHVRQALQTACLDGAFMASNAALQGAPHD